MTYASYVDQRSLGDVTTDNTMILWLTYQMFISCSCKVCCRSRQLSMSTLFYTSISWPRLSNTSPSCATPCPKHSLFTGSWGREQTELDISSLKCFYPEVTLMNSVHILFTRTNHTAMFNFKMVGKCDSSTYLEKEEDMDIGKELLCLPYQQNSQQIYV